MDGLQPTEDAIQLASTILLENIRNRITTLVGDSSAVSWLKTEIKIFDCAALAIYEHLDREASRLRQQLNRHALIHRLPNEILTHILHLDLRDVYVQPAKVRGRRKQLASVSHLWLQIFKQTPLLWTNLSTVDSEWGIALRKSQDAPLHVHYISYQYDHWKSTPLSTAFLEGVGPCAHRWQSVWAEVDQDQDATCLQMSLQDATSTLQTLVLHNKTHSPDLPVYLAETTQRSLRKVSLHQVVAGWAFSNLRSLELFMIRTAPTLAHLDKILASSPLLSTLTLNNLISPPSTEPVRSTQMHFPSLLSLHVQQCPKDYQTYVATNVRSPVIKSLYFDAANVDDEDETAQGVFQLAMPAFRSQSLIRMTCSVTNGSVQIGSRNPRLVTGRSSIDINQPDEFWILIKTRAPMQTFVTASKTINASDSLADIHLTIDGGHTRSDIATSCCSLEVLDLLPNIRSIETKCQSGAESFIKHLGERVIADDGLVYNPCPNLDFLNLWAVNISRHMIDVLQAKRVNRISKVEMRGRLGYPIPPSMLSGGLGYA